VSAEKFSGGAIEKRPKNSTINPSMIKPLPGEGATEKKTKK